MPYLEQIRSGHNDPASLENLYQAALQAHEADQFTASLLTCYQESPSNLLYAAWFYRLQAAPREEPAGRNINWKAAVPLSVALGLILWILSDPRFQLPNDVPYLGLMWAPIVSCFVIAFLTVTNRQYTIRSLLISIAIIWAILYVTLFTKSPGRFRYRDLMALHLPLLAWIGVGASILGSRSDHQNRFAFLSKSIEVFVTGGIFIIAGGVFVAITFGMFDALNISIPDTITRLLLAGGGGLVPVLAVASVYDPLVRPADQIFEQGVGKLISTLTRILLPLTLLVLVVYLIFIPFNFMEPFNERDVLIVYNAMLFAIMVLLVGVTPVRESHLPQLHRTALRRGVLAVAILAVLISLYALSATLHRTLTDDLGLSMNRLTIIGWNSINIGILSLLIYRFYKRGPQEWVRSLQSTFGLGAIAYVVWTIFLILAIPLLFKA
jgi:hypothetical protein